MSTTPADLCCDIPGCTESLKRRDEWQDTEQILDQATINMAFLDSRGAEHFAVARTTTSAEALLRNAEKLRETMSVYYELVGCKLLSLQVSVESSHILAGSRPEQSKPRTKPLLRLIQGGLNKLSLVGFLSYWVFGEFVIDKISAFS